MAERVYDPNEFKVVSVKNITDFDFTPELGCMFDGRPLFVAAGETRNFPFHVGNKLAENLAKQILLRRSPSVDVQNDQKNPIGTVLWGDGDIDKLKAEIMKELYTEEAPL